MNQGNDKNHAGDDGVYHDGCLVFEYPSGGFRAFFLAFQSQSFDTDDVTGHAKKAGPGKKASGKGPARAPRHRSRRRRRTRH